jgi:hypothetical protein
MQAANHPQHMYGQETVETKTDRTSRLAGFPNLEAISFDLGATSGFHLHERRLCIICTLNTLES